MNLEKKNWTIICCSSEDENMYLFHVNGTKDQVKSYIMELIKNTAKKSKKVIIHAGTMALRVLKKLEMILILKILIY